MSDRLERLILVRHGETEGQSSIRYSGATDIPLSELGREQVRRARALVASQDFEVVWASSLSRAAESARILVPGQTIRLEADFREVHFGRWEGLTREEIAARDPELFAVWQRDLAGFDYPGGERRSDFRVRIARGLGRLRRAVRRPPSSWPTRASCGRCSTSSAARRSRATSPSWAESSMSPRYPRSLATGRLEQRFSRRRGLTRSVARRIPRPATAALTSRPAPASRPPP